MKRLLISFTLLSLVLASVQAQPKRIRVPQDQPTVQAGINAATNGDTVLVAEGTYSVNLVLTKKITLGSLYLIDGDTSHISKTILNGSSPRPVDSASVITIDGVTDTTTMIVGFTIKGGQGNRRITPDALVYRVGTGIDVAGGGATIRKNFITGNNVSVAGRVSAVVNIWDVLDVSGISFVILEDNVIADNSLTSSNDNVEGGAFAIGHPCRISRNRVLRNSANSPTLGKFGMGGGAQIWSGQVVFDQNLFLQNTVTDFGGAIQMNLIGGGMVTLVNNIIANNSAGSQGGALWASWASSMILSINNTIIGNVSPAGSGLYMKDTASFKAINTILWNPGGSEVSLATGGSVVAAYSDIRGGLAGTGNINSDPLFFSSHADSLGWFRYNSPSRNAGVASATVGGVLLTAPSKDYYGHNRVGAVDIGAFEEGAWSGVEDVSEGIPTDFVLEQNFPNPFNPSTTIRFSLASESDVQISIYNVLGQKVEELVNERLSAGFKQVAWTANVPSGVYLYRITVSTVGGQRYEQTKKMVLLR